MNDLPDLSHLTEEERNKILAVLNRDEKLQQKQSSTLVQLKQEIDIIECNSLDIPSEHVETATVCIRCKESFGYFYFYNQGDFCPKCHYKVCQKCQIYQLDIQTKWLCILCHKHNQYLVRTGEWIHADNNNKSPTDSTTSPTGKLRKNSLTASQIIKLTLLPDKKDEILDEINNTNRLARKSTLNRSTSVLKPHRSTSCSSHAAVNKEEMENKRHITINDKKNNSVASSNLSLFQQAALSADKQGKNRPPLDFRKFSIDTEPMRTTPKKLSLTYDVNAQDNRNKPTLRAITFAKPASILTSPTGKPMAAKAINPVKISPVNDSDKLSPSKHDKHFQFASNEPEVKKISDNDLDSVTSSEFDDFSVNSDSIRHADSMRKSYRQTKAIVEQKLMSDLKSSPEAADSEMDITEKNFYMLQASKMNSRTSLESSASKNRLTDMNSDNDDTFSQMDQIFAQVKQSIESKSSTNDYNNNNSNKNTTNTNSNKAVIEEEGEDNEIERHLPDKSPQTNPVRRRSSFRNIAAHMSLMRRPKSGTRKASFERQSSSRSMDIPDYASDLAVQGRIQIRLDYERKSSNLNVKIIRCENLAPVANKTCDPYVKIYLIPGNKDKNNKRKTSVKKATVEPEFNETLRYVLGHMELCRNKLWISVWHSDKFSRNKFLGEISVPLEPDLLLKSLAEWYDLTKRHYLFNQNLSIDKVFSSVDSDKLELSRQSFCK